MERLLVEEDMDLIGFYSGGYAAPLTGFEWAKSVVVFGLGVEEEELLVGVRQKGWSRARQFVDQILDLAACRVANLLLRNGYLSEVVSSSCGRADLRALALLCGLGSPGKNGLVITPAHGPRVRFAAVATDAVLPGYGGNSTELCSGCDACVRACPAGAIGESFDAQRCLEYSLRSERRGKRCTLCTDVCPAGVGEP
ncbi:4Fe-4S binding protein [Candidatus Pyrohabitans sp.]